jgi:hypothetical protein
MMVKHADTLVAFATMLGAFADRGLAHGAISVQSPSSTSIRAIEEKLWIC